MNSLQLRRRTLNLRKVGAEPRTAVALPFVGPSGVASVRTRRRRLKRDPGASRRQRAGASKFRLLPPHDILPQQWSAKRLGSGAGQNEERRT